MVKKVCIFSILIIFGLSQILAAPCGDVNSSGAIDIVDALMTAQYYVGLDPQPYDVSAADASGDSMINIVDALLTAQYYVGLITTLQGCAPTVPPECISQTYKLQAETEAIWDEATVDSYYSGWTGTGFVNTANVYGCWIEWNIDVSAASSATCVFTYANGSTSSRSMDVSINSSVVTSLDFPVTGAWDTWSTDTTAVILAAGSNAIRVTAANSAGAPNMDKMDITIDLGCIVTPTPTPDPEVQNIIGLTIVVDFPDRTGTIPMSDMEEWLNGENYTGYGNNGSVNEYFNDVSGGKINCQNIVFGYYTLSQNRDYYDNLSRPTSSREMLTEALDWLKTSGLDFSGLTTDNNSYVTIVNLIYAGSFSETSATLESGLRGHKSNLYMTYDLNGYLIYNYQMAEQNDPHGDLVLFTFCHETGHLLFGWPDLYDTDPVSEQQSHGLGAYCLMSFVKDKKNPVPPNSYLRELEGWETIMNANDYIDNDTIVLPANENISFKYENPDNPNEFFIMEARKQNGRSASLLSEGLMILHVDKKGSNCYDVMEPNQHYKVSLEQADGFYDLEHYRAPYGDADLFPNEGKTEFSAQTIPDSRWWSGVNSGLKIDNIMWEGDSIRFTFHRETQCINIPETISKNANENTITQTSLTINNTGDDELWVLPRTTHNGYTYLTSDDTGGPVYEWNSIALLENKLPLFYPDESAIVSLDFNFSYFDRSYSTIGVNSGYITVGNNPTLYDNMYSGNLPHLKYSANLISIFLDRLSYYNSPGGAVYFFGDNTKCVIEYENIENLYDQLFTMQIQLHADGRILFLYKDVPDNIATGLVGIQNDRCDRGITPAQNEVFIKDLFSVEFIPINDYRLRFSTEPITIPASSTYELTITYDSTALTEGTYSDTIELLHNEVGKLSPATIASMFTVENLILPNLITDSGFNSGILDVFTAIY